jgi:hypothetical protein
MKGVEALQGFVQLCGLNENFLDGRFHNYRPNGVHPDVVVSQFYDARAEGMQTCLCHRVSR